MNRYEVRSSTQLSSIAIVDTVAQEVIRELHDTPENRTAALAECNQLNDLDAWFEQHDHTSYGHLLRSTVN